MTGNNGITAKKDKKLGKKNLITLNALLAIRRPTMLASAPKKSQELSLGLSNIRLQYWR